MEVISVKHSGNAGDVVYALQSLSQSGYKARLYLNPDVPAFYYPGATHPVKDSDGVKVMLNSKMIAMLKPLIEAQPYIESVSEFHGERIIVDLDHMRQVETGMPYLSIQRWYGYAFPDLYVDISKQWLTGVAPDFSFKNSVIINRTSRYNNPWVNYGFLRDMPKDSVVFAGLPEEHSAFCDKFNLDIPLLMVDDFKQLASYILGCGFFLGNQSMCFGIAEGFKVPRLLETSLLAPNVIPTGDHAKDFLSQEGLDYWFDRMFKEHCCNI